MRPRSDKTSTLTCDAPQPTDFVKCACVNVSVRREYQSDIADAFIRTQKATAASIIHIMYSKTFVIPFEHYDSLNSQGREVDE